MNVLSTKDGGKVLFFDIETAPNLAYVWGKYEQNVIQYEDEWYMLSFAYKWMDHPVQAFGLPSFSAFRKNRHSDKALVSKLHEILSEADIIVAHNGLDFDIRKSNARFIYYGLSPIKPSKVIDTKAIAKKIFSFNSNKLNDLCTYLGIGAKEETGGFELWKGCMDGDLNAWRKMLRYNKNDVVILEKLYKKLSPWIWNGIVSSRGVCPNCGSFRFNQHGFYFTNLKKYRRLQCQECGQWCRENV